MAIANWTNSNEFYAAACNYKNNWTVNWAHIYQEITTEKLQLFIVMLLKAETKTTLEQSQTGWFWNLLDRLRANYKPQQGLNKNLSNF